MLHALAWTLAAAAGFGLVFAQTYKTKVEDAFVTVNVDLLLSADRPTIPAPPEDGAAGAPVTILILGSDEGEDRDGRRADATLLAHISADRARVDAVSIPRDTMLTVAGCTKPNGSPRDAHFAMFNEAFSIGAGDTSDAGGAACVINTLEAITDVRIDHFVVLNMQGFANVVDALGGVAMCIPQPLKDKATGLDLAAGPQKLTGQTALYYARSRKGTGQSGSDLDRIDRQQEMLKNLLRQAVSAEMLFRPQDLTHFISEVASSLTMDEQMGDLDFLAGLAWSLRHLDPNTGIVFATAPVEDYPADKNRVQLSGRAPAMWDALRSDEPIAPLLDAQSDSPANDVSGAIPPSAAATPDDAVDPNSQEGILNACTAG